MTQLTRNRSYPVIATRQDILDHNAMKGDYVVFGDISRGESLSRKIVNGHEVVGEKFTEKETFNFGTIAGFDKHTGDPIIKYYDGEGKESRISIDRISNNPQKRLAEVGKVADLTTISEESKKSIALEIEAEKRRRELSLPSKEREIIAVYNNEMVEVEDGEIRHRLLGENKLLTLKLKFITGVEAGRVGEFDFRTGKLTLEPLPSQKPNVIHSVKFKNTP